MCRASSRTPFEHSFDSPGRKSLNSGRHFAGWRENPGSTEFRPYVAPMRVPTWQVDEPEKTEAKQEVIWQHLNALVYVL